MFGQRLGKGGGGIAHCANGDTQDHQIDLAHRIGGGFTDRPDQAALTRDGADIGIGVETGGEDPRRMFAQGQPDRTAQQAQTDDRDLVDHAASPHSLRKAAITRVMSSLWPMVMRKACLRPGSGR